MKVINNLFDSFFNESVIDELRTADFTLALDPPPEGKSDSGFVHSSLQGGNVNSLLSAKLNAYAELILKKIVRLNPDLRNYFPQRYVWNYYNKSSSGTYHPDSLEPDHISIVYYLNTCDGGTFIEDKFIESKEGRAVIFNSDVSHCGIGPTEHNARYVLNIVLVKDNQ